MSITPPPPDAREWDRQEAGRRVTHGDAPMDDYRLVAQAIATAPRSRPPADFAVAVAAKARAGVPDPGYERRLAGGLLLLLGATALVAGVVAVGPAWQALRLGLGPAGAAWMAVPGACIALGWALGQVRQLHTVARAMSP